MTRRKLERQPSAAGQPRRLGRRKTSVKAASPHQLQAFSPNTAGLRSAAANRPVILRAKNGHGFSDGRSCGETAHSSGTTMPRPAPHGRASIGQGGRALPGRIAPAVGRRKKPADLCKSRGLCRSPKRSQHSEEQGIAFSKGQRQAVDPRAWLPEGLGQGYRKLEEGNHSSGSGPRPLRGCWDASGFAALPGDRKGVLAGGSMVRGGGDLDIRRAQEQGSGKTLVRCRRGAKTARAFSGEEARSF